MIRGGMHYMNRAGGPYWTNYEVQPEHPNLQPMMDTFQRVSRLRAYEAPLEVIESVLRYLGAINIISTAIILTCKVAHVRKDLLIQWLLVRDLLRRKPKEYRIVPSGNAHKVEKAVIEALHKSRTSDRGVELESWGVRPKGIFTKMQNEVTTTEIGLGKREDVGEEKKHSSAGYAKVKLNPMKSAARNNTQEPAIQSHRIYSL
ncbi:unnamed protein product [Dicrocoelium dendriticum]|nr:unnamed protein product [Dicrocoelium dendriticum]